MAGNNKAAWQVMISQLQAMGGVSAAHLGEPRSGAQTGMVALIPQSGEVDETTLTSPREVHNVLLRRYEDVEQQPQAEIEYRLDDWRAQLLADIFGDFDLGGNVAYALPAETAWEYGEDTLGNRNYRVLDLLISYRVDDNATFVE